MLLDSNNMTLWEKQNYGDSRKINSYQGLKLLCKNLDTCHYKFV